MMRFVKHVVAVATVFAGINAGAQDGQKEIRLTLKECVEVALMNSTAIELSKYDVAIATTNVDVARNRFFPISSNASWSINRSVQGPREGQILDETTGTLVQTLGEDRIGGGQSFSIGGFSMPLYNGQIISQLAGSKKSLRQAEMQQIGGRQDVMFQTKQRYFQLLQAIKLLEVQQERVRVSEESLRRAETLYEIGSAAILQVANAMTTLANTRVTLIQRENNVALARLNLAFTMGLGTDVDIIPAEEEFEILPLKYTYEDALAIALSDHPDILATKYGMMASRDNYDATRKGLYHPTLTMSTGSYSWNIGKDEDFDGVEDIFLKNYSYSIRISGSIPIFNLNTSNTLKRTNTHTSHPNTPLCGRRGVRA